MIALIVGTVLAVAGVAYVLMPLLRAAAAGGTVNPTAANAEPSAESSAIEALREIEFDRATGKLSDDDYSALKAQYTPRALIELRARESTTLSGEVGEVREGLPPSSPSSPFKEVAVASSLDPAEALIAAVSARGLICLTDGPRPETDALFCSDCGRALVAPTSAAAAR